MTTIGTPDQYIALHTPDQPIEGKQISQINTIGFNHIGVVVDDLDAIEKLVKQAGYNPNSHQDYEPGRRFYFHDDDGVEYEVVSYA